MTDEQIARVCHEANSAYCVAVGDPLLPHWDDLDAATQQSNIRGVQFTLANAATPAIQHEMWRTTRLEQGWVYGPVLDRAAKIHPNLVDYDQLPHAQRVKDRLFMAIVHVLK